MGFCTDECCSADARRAAQAARQLQRDEAEQLFYQWLRANGKTLTVKELLREQAVETHLAVASH